MRKFEESISAVRFSYDEGRAYPLHIASGTMELPWIFSNENIKKIYTVISSFILDNKDKNPVLINGVKFRYFKGFLRIALRDDTHNEWKFSNTTIQKKILPFLERCLMKKFEKYISGVNFSYDEESKHPSLKIYSGVDHAPWIFNIYDIKEIFNTIRDWTCKTIDITSKKIADVKFGYNDNILTIQNSYNDNWSFGLATIKEDILPFLKRCLGNSAVDYNQVPLEKKETTTMAKVSYKVQFQFVPSVKQEEAGEEAKILGTFDEMGRSETDAAVIAALKNQEALKPIVAKPGRLSTVVRPF